MPCVNGIELRQLRVALGLTQAEFAAALGEHWNTLARQERGEIKIRETLARLARVLATQSPRRRPTPTRTKRTGDLAGRARRRA
jgi:transcriptional regulator with XRE-family HTH domain